MNMNLTNYYYSCYASKSLIDKIQEFKKNELKQRERLFGTMFFKNTDKYIDRQEINFINTLYHNNFEKFEKYIMKSYYNYMYMFFQEKEIFYKKKYLSMLTFIYKAIIEEIKEIGGNKV